MAEKREVDCLTRKMRLGEDWAVKFGYSHYWLARSKLRHYGSLAVRHTHFDFSLANRNIHTRVIVSAHSEVKRRRREVGAARCARAGAVRMLLCCDAARD